MARFETRDEGFRARIEESFAMQPFAQYLGAELVHVAPGEVDIRLAFRPELTQQHGYVHGGVLTTIADVAAGYAAMTLAARGTGVLTTDLKVNFLRPAGRGALVASGRVIKPGRLLNIVQVDVREMREPDTHPAGAQMGGQVLPQTGVHVQTGLVTMMFVEGLM